MRGELQCCHTRRGRASERGVTLTPPKRVPPRALQRSRGVQSRPARQLTASRFALAQPATAALTVDVIDQHELAEPLRFGEKGAAVVDFGHLIDKATQRVTTL